MLQNLQYIHPLNRERVEELAGYLAEKPAVEQITIFGSSVTSRCHNHSDVDIYVALDNAGDFATDNGRAEQRLIDRYFDFSYDLWTNFQVDERLLKEIQKKGVVVYERG
jgi:predicted nucleotidyltransferase